MVNFYSCLLLFCVVFFVQGSKKCVLPKSKTVNWSKLTGNWFEVINTKSPVDQVIKCFKLNDFEALKNGFSYNISDYHLPAKTYEGLITIFKEKSGIYSIAKENAAKLKSIVMKDVPHASILLLVPTVQEAANLAGSKAVFYTDYKNYLIDFRCAKNGQKYIWVMSTNTKPTAEDALRVTNVLAGVGKGWNSIPLYLSGCATTAENLTLFKKV